MDSLISKDLTDLFHQKLQILGSARMHYQDNKSYNLKQGQAIDQKLTIVQVKINRLHKIAKKSNMFNREDDQINQLSEQINHILVDCQNTLSIIKQQLDGEVEIVMNQIIEARLIRLSNDFKKQLQQRTQDLQCFEDNKQKVYQYNEPITKEGGMKKRRKIDYQRRNIYLDQEEKSDQINIEIHEQTQLVHRERKQRNQSIKQIENLLTEIGGIFQKIGNIVQHQETMVDRLDKHTDDTLFYIEKGKTNLTKAYQDISSNRNLIIKVFIVLFVFAFVYINFLL